MYVISSVTWLSIGLSAVCGPNHWSSKLLNFLICEATLNVLLQRFDPALLEVHDEKTTERR